MSEGTTWRLCAVRMTAPDEGGRFAVSEVAPMDLRAVAKVAEAMDGAGVLDGAIFLAAGAPDTPDVREALGLKPRPAFQRGEDKAHTGVAGVMG